MKLVMSSLLFLGVQLSAAPKGAEADPIQGRWHYFNDHVLTISSGGNMTSNKGATGNWVFLKNPEVERKYRMQWEGNPLVDTMTLSRDGKKLEGKNNKGSRVWATRVPKLTE